MLCVWVYAHVGIQTHTRTAALQTFIFLSIPHSFSPLSHLSRSFISFFLPYISLSIYLFISPSFISLSPSFISPPSLFSLSLSPPGCTRVTRAGDRWYPHEPRPNQWQRLTLNMMSMILNSHYRLVIIKL